MIFAVALVGVLRRKLWSQLGGDAAQRIVAGFLAEQFLQISDFIHLQDVQRVDLIYDTVMMTSFIYTGVTLGFSSLYLIHLQLRRRFHRLTAASLIALTLLLSSVAVI